MSELDTKKVIQSRSEWCEVLTKIESQIVDQRINSGTDKIRKDACTMGEAILDYLKAVNMDKETTHPIPDLTVIDIDDEHRLESFLVIEQMYALADDSHKEWIQALDETLFFLYPEHHKAIEENK